MLVCAPVGQFVGSMVDLRVLGPVEIWIDGRRVNAGPPQQRCVLAALLVDAGRVVTTESLIDRVWDEAPVAARRNTQALVARLRRILEQASTPSAVVRVEGRGGGYVLEADPDWVDVLRFRRMVEQARGADHDATRVALLDQALGLWRGEPLSGLSGAWVDRTRQAWRQQYLDAVVAWARAKLRTGGAAEVIGRLTELAGEHPLVESLPELLMRAYHAVGRSAEALDLYSTFRQRLAEELGTDPGAELRTVHELILRGELDAAPQAGAKTPATGPVPPPDPGTGWAVPAQLPADARHFTGRDAEVDRLVRLAEQADEVLVVAVDGMAGVGKTTLAVRAAHRLVRAGGFPDGQLFLDLRGFSGGRPTDPAAALDTLLRGLGIPGQQIPPDLDARVGLYRSVLARRRVLIVLDNAHSEAQVRALLPGTGRSVVLVTSRRRLSGLDEAEHLGVDTLHPDHAARLFRTVAGADRDPGDERTVREIAELCGLLPLAVRIAAARLRADRGRVPVTGTQVLELLRRRHDQHRLAELSEGDRSVAAAFTVSYQHLSVEQRRAFVALSLHPGLEYEPAAAAALLDTTIARARDLLTALEQVNLLEQLAPGRYRYHDLIREFAASADPPVDGVRRAALDRLYDHYARVATAAMTLAYPYDADNLPVAPAVATPVAPALSDREQALAWLITELDNLLPAAHHAAVDRPDHTIHQSGTLHRYLCTRAHYADAVDLHQRALTAARTAGDQTAEVHTLNRLGHLERRQGRYETATERFELVLTMDPGAGSDRAHVDAHIGLGHVHTAQGRQREAIEHFGRALTAARATAYGLGQLDALNGLGWAYYVQDRNGAATECHTEALAVARSIGSRPGEVEALNSLGRIHYTQGRHPEAVDVFTVGAQAARITGNRAAETNALAGLGFVHAARGQFDAAIACMNQVLEFARETGHRQAEINALSGLARAYRGNGDYELAMRCHAESLELARAAGNRNFEFEGQLGFGRTLQAAGAPDRALVAHRRALTIAEGLAQPADEARAHDGVAHAHCTLGRFDDAAEHWRRAIDILAGLGVTCADDISTAEINAQLEQLEELTSPAVRR